MKFERGDSFQQEQLVSIATLARMLAVSRRTAQRIVKSGAIPAYRIGGGTRVRIADVHSYLQANRSAVPVSASQESPQGLKGLLRLVSRRVLATRAKAISGGAE